MPEIKYFGSDFLSRLDVKQDRKTMKNVDKKKQRSAVDRVLDEKTYFLLYKWLNSGDLNEMVGLISAGKEANVYFGYGKQRQPVAIKIYKIDPHSAKWMMNYIRGDPRFAKIGNTTAKIIYTWGRKEFKNLSRLQKHNIRSPVPFKVKDNVLLMSYIGENDGNPAPRLKDVQEFENLNKEISCSMGFIEDMYVKAQLVHGDLSEFNILYHKGDQILIDVSQAITYLHPRALEFLVRDIKNVWNFWNKFERNPFNMEDFYYKIIR
jgi:RIO kinase 1